VPIIVAQVLDSTSTSWWELIGIFEEFLLRWDACVHSLARRIRLKPEASFPFYRTRRLSISYSCGLTTSSGELLILQRRQQHLKEKFPAGYFDGPNTTLSLKASESLRLLKDEIRPQKYFPSSNKSELERALLDTWWHEQFPGTRECPHNRWPFPRISFIPTSRVISAKILRKTGRLMKLVH
jgi:hypothetical protein